MRALWPLVGCLLCMVVRPAVSSNSSCHWQDLVMEHFSAGTIQVRTKDEEQQGKLTMKIEDWIINSMPMEPSRLYTLNMTCTNNRCFYSLLNDIDDTINNGNATAITSQKFSVDGKNLEWSPVCQGEDTETTATTMTTTTKPITTTTTTTPETTTTSTTTPETITTSSTTPETTTTITTTRRTTKMTTPITTLPQTTLGKKTPPSTSTHRTPTPTTTTTAAAATPRTRKASKKNSNTRLVIISITVFTLFASVLGMCFIYRHRIHSGALDVYSRARAVMEGAQSQEERQGSPVFKMTETPV